MSLPERITSRVRVAASGCWEWTGSLRDGYGQTTIDGRKVKVHRIYYVDLVGPIPEGLDLDHLCRNRTCCNPDHLEPVTRSENLRRSPLMRENNGNASKVECTNGHPFDEANTYVHPKTGHRHCRPCNAEARRRYVDRMILVGQS